MKMFKVEKTNATNEKYNETYYLNLDLITKVKFTPDSVEFTASNNDSVKFTKSETGETQFKNMRAELEK